MKKLLRLATLLGIMGAASWGDANRPAFADAPCDLLNGTSCSPAGAKTTCTTSDGFASSCTCTRALQWRCLL
jgi:hypothetical protein